MTEDVTHLIEVIPSEWIGGWLSWTCSCGETPGASYVDLVAAVSETVRHLQPTDRWAIQQDPRLTEAP